MLQLFALFTRISGLLFFSIAGAHLNFDFIVQFFSSSPLSPTPFTTFFYTFYYFSFFLVLWSVLYKLNNHSYHLLSIGGRREVFVEQGKKGENTEEQVFVSQVVRILRVSNSPALPCLQVDNRHGIETQGSGAWRRWRVQHHWHFIQ